jgi:hypothetical protein
VEALKTCGPEGAGTADSFEQVRINNDEPMSKFTLGWWIRSRRCQVVEAVRAVLGGETPLDHDLAMRLLRLRGGRHLSGRRVGEGGPAGLRHRDLTPRPSTRQFGRAARPVVTGARVLEVVQHMLGTIGRPDREAVMVGVL